MNSRERSQLKKSFGRHVRSAALLLTDWKDCLTPEQTSQLKGFEAKGLRLALTVARPEELWVVHVILLDAAGGSQRLDTIELGGAMPSLSIN